MNTLKTHEILNKAFRELPHTFVPGFLEVRTEAVSTAEEALRRISEFGGEGWIQLAEQKEILTFEDNSPLGTNEGWPVQAEAEEAAAPAAGGGRFSAFGQAAPATTQTSELEASSDMLPVGPLVFSRVHVPVSNYEGGTRFTVNYLALLLALVVYTGAFIGEIVRGGIQAVAKGQREAANALGLSGYQTFSLVVFPQALRIVLPPVISQYLNLTKNSSLATLAGYAELFVIASVVSNQTGAAIPIALLLIGAYLAISLTFSVVLNKVNASLALVER